MSYGIKVFGPDNQTVVFSDGIRTSNVQVYEGFSLSPNEVSDIISCPNANDSTKVAVTITPTANIGLIGLRDVSVTNKTSTGVQLSNGGNNFGSGIAIAFRLS
mgnify:FL=1